MEIIYCKKCVQPNTRPGIIINNQGICSGCIGHLEKEKHINWEEREKELLSIIERFKGKEYDAIVPVSGGKDSTYQTYILKKKLGMNPLCVTYKTPLRTKLGQKNLDNLIDAIGVDLIELSVNPNTERKFIWKTLQESGDCGVPEHLGIFSFTLRMAIKLGIKLIVWGENPQLEYGGTKKERLNTKLDVNWLTRHGLLQNKLALDWADENLSPRELAPFCLPQQEELEKAQINSIFLGSFIKWDPLENYKIAKSLGFQKREKGPVMGLYDFADIDCKLMALHHYPKWLKFGMSRTFDNASVEIRNGRLTREQAIEAIKDNAPDFPPYNHLEDFCNFLEVTKDDVNNALEPFRNLQIWEKDDNGQWFIPNFIVSDFNWQGKDKL